MQDVAAPRRDEATVECKSDKTRATPFLIITSCFILRAVMLSLVHTLISLPFAYYLEHPLLIFLAAFMFHLMADTFLHWNFYPDVLPRKVFYVGVAVEISVGVLCAWLLLGRDFLTLPVLAAVAGGNMPDIIHQLWELIPLRVRKEKLTWATPFFTMHDSLQYETTSISAGLVSQVILVIAAVGLVAAQLS